MSKYTLRQQIENCATLGRILASGIPGVVYDHATFSRHRECGTAACALGHAFASGAFPELTLLPSRYPDFVQAARNLGIHGDYSADVADAVFGTNAYHDVFCEIDQDKPSDDAARYRRSWTEVDALRALQKHTASLTRRLRSEEAQGASQPDDWCRVACDCTDGVCQREAQS